MTIQDRINKVELSNSARGIMSVALKVAQMEVGPPITLTGAHWEEHWIASAVRHRQRLNIIASKLDILDKAIKEAANESA